MFLRGQRKKALLIVNPKSGSGRSAGVIAPCITALADAGWETLAFTTSCRGDAVQIAADYGADADLLVCSGGDGTMDEVIRGVMELDKQDRPRIGYLPMGSTNDFASALRLPKRLDQMIDTVINGSAKEVDVGCFNGRYYAYLASFGAFTDMSRSTSQEAKNALGFLAYLGGGMNSIANIRPMHITAVANGTIIDDEFAFGAVSNTTSVAKLINYKDALTDLNDGLFEVIFIKYPVNPIELGKIAHAITAGDFSTDLVTHFRCSEVTIGFDEPVPWILDGEDADCGHEVVIKNVHSAVRIMVPVMDLSTQFG